MEFIKIRVLPKLNDDPLILKADIELEVVKNGCVERAEFFVNDDDDDCSDKKIGLGYGNDVVELRLDPSIAEESLVDNLKRLLIDFNNAYDYINLSVAAECFPATVNLYFSWALDESIILTLDRYVYEVARMLLGEERIDAYHLPNLYDYNNFGTMYKRLPAAIVYHPRLFYLTLKLCKNIIHKATQEDGKDFPVPLYRCRGILINECQSLILKNSFLSRVELQELISLAENYTPGDFYKNWGIQMTSMKR